MSITQKQSNQREPKEYPIPEFNPDKYILTIRVLKIIGIALTITWIILLSYFVYNFPDMGEPMPLTIIGGVSAIYFLQMIGLVVLCKHLTIRNEIHSEVDPEERTKLSMLFSKNATQAMKSVAAKDLQIRKKGKCKIFKKSISNQCDGD